MADETDHAPLTMLTFAPMVDSELTRLLLAHYGLRYREADHLFGWVSLLTLVHGGYGRVPILYGDGVRLTAPRPIANHYDPLAAPERRLIPEDAALARQVEADWHRYNDEMAADTAVFAYYHLLPMRELMTPIFAAPVPPGQARKTARAYPFMRGLFGVLLRLGPERAEAALARIRTIVAETDRRVEDGRLYLCGDRLTLGDLALASAAAPLLIPAGYGAKLPPVELMPAALRKTILELRDRPTGKFVQQLYASGLPAARVGA